MRGFKVVAVGLSLLALLAACSSSAPVAPIGLDKHPANSPATIAELSRALDAPPSQAAPTAVDVALAPARAATSQYMTYLVVSDFNAPGGLASMSADVQAQAVLSAQHAANIIVRARTDYTSSTARARCDAIGRGARTKRYFVGHGVPAEKIRVFYRSSGGFVDSNTSAVGRSKNRRVEIQFM